MEEVVMNRDIAVTLGVLVFAAGMFIWEKIPLALTSVIASISLVVFGILTPAQGFAGFIDPNIIIFFTMFIVGGAMFETGAAEKIGSIVIKYAKTEKQALILMFLVAAFLSALLSNTATTAIFIPITLGIAYKGAVSKSKLLMSMAVASNMGGGLSLIGTPPNLIVNSVLEQYSGESFGFFEFSIVSLPMVLITVVYYATIGHKYLPERESLQRIESETTTPTPVWKTNASMIILAATVLSMFIQPFDIPLHVSSSIGAIAVVLTKLMSEKQAYASVDFSTIFLFSGTLALAQALNVSGAGALIATTFITLLGENASPMVLLVAILFISIPLTNFMSNTATTAILAPLGFSIATAMNADPRAVLMATAVGGTIAYLTPIGTPPLTMIYGVGGYKFTDYAKSNWPIIIISIVVTLVMLPIFFPFFP